MAWASPREDIAGLDVGDSYVAVARMRRRRNAVPLLTRVAVADCDMSGDPDAVTAAIRGLWRSSGLATRTVYTAMHSRSLLYRYCALGGVSGEDEVAAALRIEAEEALQLPPNEIAMDWHPNPPRERTQAPGSAVREGMLVAMPAHEVDRHVQIVRKAGLYPVVVDTRCMAVSNLFLAQQRESVADRVVCLTHLGASSAETVIFFGGGIYARSVYFRAGGDEGERLEHLLGSMQDVLKYFRFKLHNQPVEELVLTGLIADPPAAERQAKEACGVPTRYWNPVTSIDAHVRTAAVLQADAQRLSTALGLAMRGMDDG